jgi:hypothetical protein
VAWPGFEGGGDEGGGEGESLGADVAGGVEGNVEPCVAPVPDGGLCLANSHAAPVPPTTRTMAMAKAAGRSAARFLVAALP